MASEGGVGDTLSPCVAGDSCWHPLVGGDERTEEGGVDGGGLAFMSKIISEEFGGGPSKDEETLSSHLLFSSTRDELQEILASWTQDSVASTGFSTQISTFSSIASPPWKPFSRTFRTEGSTKRGVAVH